MLPTHLSRFTHGCPYVIMVPHASGQKALFLEHIICSGALTFTVPLMGATFTPLLPSAETLVPFKANSNFSFSLKAFWFPELVEGGWPCALVIPFSTLFLSYVSKASLKRCCKIKSTSHIFFNSKKDEPEHRQNQVKASPNLATQIAQFPTSGAHSWSPGFQGAAVLYLLALPTHTACLPDSVWLPLHISCCP